MWDRAEQELFEALAETPVIDVHTHLVDGHLGARGLHEILLYHMVVSDLYAAGCPSGSRLTEYPGWPSPQEAQRRVEEALPYLELARSTSTAWAVRMILADLYDWHQPVHARNWRDLHALIQAREWDGDWHRQVLRRANIKRVGTEWARRQTGRDDDILEYALEWGFFTRCRWGEYDTALCELEACWGRPPGTATPIAAGKRPPAERPIRTLEDVHEAVADYVAAFPKDRMRAAATHISTDLDLRPVTDDEMAIALARRDHAGEHERSVCASYINERYLRELERQAPHVVFQFSLGAEPLPFETGSRLSQRTIAQIGELCSRHPAVRFMCFLASRHGNQGLCTLCRELPNLSLAGYWWHNFFPDAMRQVMEERLDMLPLNKQIGFFSDAYCVEWTYGKMQMMRRCLAEALGRRVRIGQYTKDDALAVARHILHESPRQLLGFEPSAAL
ncbi:MAG TPA: hypothetical protein PKI11_02025 [Candidatus Hydrogenedentes bacterium]|nr:hypothetical protein [Candidatus Hydrogenedentota bacterium]HNT87632.1 hypothetical protein [Candidatus Hydrogenedentota bacterium]